MQDFSTTWTRDDLKAYLLILCANADFTESQIELDYLRSHTQSDLDAIHKEFDGDNDFASLQKVQSTMSRLEYTPEDKAGLLEEIKGICLVDGAFDIQEQNLVRGLKHLFE